MLRDSHNYTVTFGEYTETTYEKGPVISIIIDVKQEIVLSEDVHLMEEHLS